MSESQFLQFVLLSAHCVHVQQFYFDPFLKCIDQVCLDLFWGFPTKPAHCAKNSRKSTFLWNSEQARSVHSGPLAIWERPPSECFFLLVFCSASFWCTLLIKIRVFPKVSVHDVSSLVYLWCRHDTYERQNGFAVSTDCQWSEQFKKIVSAYLRPLPIRDNLPAYLYGSFPITFVL